MRFTRIISLGLLLCAFSAQAAPKKPQISQKKESAALDGKDVEAKIQEVFDKFSSDPVVGRILERQMAGDLRHGIDRIMASQIESLPFYNVLRAEVQTLIEQIIQENRVGLSASVARAKTEPNGQYAKFLDMVQRVGAKQKFPVESRENAEVHVNPTSDVNAYTYSGGPGIYFVILRGLVESFAKGSVEVSKSLKAEYNIDLTPEQITDMGVEAVIGHEIGHIKAGHIRNQIMFIVLIQASMKAMMQQPALMGAETKDLNQKLESLDKAMMQKLEDAFYTDLAHTQGNDAARTFSDQAKVKLSNGIRNIADLLLRKMGPENVVLQLNAMKYAASHDGKFMPRRLGKRTISPDELMEILALMDKWGRHAETTSDRIGQISTSTLAAKFADLLLGGGQSLKAMQDQAQGLREQLFQSPWFEDGISSSTHPAMLMRLLAYDQFESDPMHKVYSTPYLTAMHTLAAVSLMIEQLQGAQDDDSLEVAGNWIAGVDKERLIAFEQELTAAVIGEIQKDLDDPSRKLETVKETATYLGYREAEGRLAKRGRYNRGIATRMNKEGGFFYELQTIIVARVNELMNGLVKNVKSLDEDIAKKLEAATTDEEKAQITKEKQTKLALLQAVTKLKLEQLVQIANPILAFAPTSAVTASKAKLSAIASDRAQGGANGGVKLGNALGEPLKLVVRMPSTKKLLAAACAVPLGGTLAGPALAIVPEGTK